MSLTLTPPAASGVKRPDPVFQGWTMLDVSYVTPVLGETPDGSSSVETIFAGEFDSSTTHSVPLRRADLSGYGASIFSDWLNADEPGPSIIKVQFEVTRGRTRYEVIKAQSMLYPHGVAIVRTVTMQRQNAGWVNCADSGWQPSSSGRFTFPDQAVVHAGAMLGVFNVRNIREQGVRPRSGVGTYQPVLFDADVGVATRLDVTAGASPVPAFEATSGRWSRPGTWSATCS